MNIPFHVVPGSAIAELLRASHDEVVELVRQTYVLHSLRQTVNPDSYFLRFDDKPTARIIALPAALRDDNPVSGIKWIASYPENVRHGLQRASATIVLNDYDTGYPVACLEGSLISAARTAASAALAAELLLPTRRIAKLCFVGGGLISGTVYEYLCARGWDIEETCIYDLLPTSSGRFAAAASPRRVVVAESLSAALHQANLVVLATTAPAPYITDPSVMEAGRVVLNLSLRDLAPSLLLAANNIFDDVEHCMKANTSAHLAEQMTGNRSFVTGTFADLNERRVCIDQTKATVVSPFGLGVLDLALARLLYARALASGSAIEIPSFFPHLAR
jgi:2,3-diaminopropionate biosynthesis protein SbnB